MELEWRRRKKRSSASRRAMVVEVAAEDRLSSLPDDVLHSILRGLPVKHAARTSALSRRWAHMWLHALAAYPVIDLADRDFALGQSPARASATVSRCLRLHAAHGGPLDVFRVAFPYPSRGLGPDIFRWLAAAVGRGAREVELYLTPPQGYRAMDADTSAFFMLPRYLLLAKNSMERLTLCRCSLRDVPPGAAGLAGLRSLSLSHADVTDKAVRDVLSNCRSLEFLSLRSCNLLWRVKIAGERLRGLEIVSCQDVLELQVTAPALESFTFHGDIISLSYDALTVRFLSATPALRHAYVSHLGFSYYDDYHHHGPAYYDVLNCVAHATTLTICSVGLQHIEWTRRFGHTMDVHTRDVRTMDVPNLQELQLVMASLGDNDVDRITGLFEFIKSPILDRLFIRLPGGSPRGKSVVLATAPLCSDEGNMDVVLDHLTFIKVVNFRGTVCELRLLKLLMNRAPALEQLVLVTVEGVGDSGDEQEQLKIIQGQVSAMRTAPPAARVTVCRPSEDGSRNPAHTRFYHEE
ncbi:hypothetical protein ACP70R_030203 [Stipagrostis hirtigluma subsp. patula]